MNYVNHDKVETLKVYKPFTAYFKSSNKSNFYY